MTPENYRRYRDDTIDICKGSDTPMQEEMNTWMNENVYQEKIIFEMKSSKEKIDFLDTTLKILPISDEESEKLLIITDMFSKKTLINTYHPNHVIQNTLQILYL